MSQHVCSIRAGGNPIVHVGNITSTAPVHVGNITSTAPHKDSCLKDLYTTDPRHDKARIEDGGLLRDCYTWILDNDKFRDWRMDENIRLLWINGDPGKGKTMLACGIINELQKGHDAHEISYFFCQASDSRLNSGTAVLRGLVYMMLEQQPQLLPHVQAKYRTAGKSLFDGVNAWVALSDILSNMLEDPDLQCKTLLIDALDECITDLPRLLDLIVKLSAKSPVKWLITSRPWPTIKEELDEVEEASMICLKLSNETISSAVDFYIENQVNRLAKKKRYKPETRRGVAEKLTSGADNTFLWVALVCKGLQDVPRVEALTELAATPPGLHHFYGKMMGNIRSSRASAISMGILALVSVTYRPVTIMELPSLIDICEDLDVDQEDLIQMVGNCGSFLTLREGTIYFVHHSAKDFLLQTERATIFPCGEGVVHYSIFTRSVCAMSAGTLKRDMYSLHLPGCPIEEVKVPDPDPISAIRYSCIFWIDHLIASDTVFYPEAAQATQHESITYDFLSQYYLYWLEAMSLLESAPRAVLWIQKLHTVLNKWGVGSELLALVRDASRFVRYCKHAIEACPLQVYASPLVFAPTRSVIRELFKHETPTWVTMKPTPKDDWDACVQTLEGHTDAVVALACSQNPEDPIIASGSFDNTVRIWDISTGECLQILRYVDPAVRIAISPDSQRLASAYEDGIIIIWDTATGHLLHTLDTQCPNNLEGRTSLSFTPDSKGLVCATEDKKIRTWGVETGKCLHTVVLDCKIINYLALSPDSHYLALQSKGNTTVGIYDLTSGRLLHGIESKGLEPKNWDWGTTESLRFCFFANSRMLLVSWNSMNMEVWDIQTCQKLKSFKGLGLGIEVDSVSCDSRQFVSSSENIVTAREFETGQVRTLRGHTQYVTVVSSSLDSSNVVSASDDMTIKIWETDGYADPLSPPDTSVDIRSVTLSPDLRYLVSVSDTSRSTVKVWDMKTGHCLQTLYSDPFFSFSPDSKYLALSRDRTVYIRDLGENRLTSTLCCDSGTITSIVFTHDSRRVIVYNCAAAIITVCDVDTGACLSVLQGKSGCIYDPSEPPFLHVSPCSKILACQVSLGIILFDLEPEGTQETSHVAGDNEGYRPPSHSIQEVVNFVAFSGNSKHLALPLADNAILIWLIETAHTLQILGGHSDTVGSVIFLPDPQYLVSASFDQTLKIWDVVTGMCLQAVNTGKVALNLSLDPSGQYLQTDVGAFNLGMSAGSPHPTAPKLCSSGYGISPDGAWVTWNTTNILWLPSEFRSIHNEGFRMSQIRPTSAISNTGVAPSLGSTGVVFLHFLVDRILVDRLGKGPREP